MPERFGAGRLIAVMAGLATVTLALSSLLDELGHQLLLAHMIQHLLLMAVAPPLLWMGAPLAPMLLGLPRPIRRSVAIVLASNLLRRLTHVLADPRVSWVAFAIAFWAWHLPALYDRSLRSDSWHHVQHACFFATGLLFWRSVFLPRPTRSSWPRWAMIPYLVLAELQNQHAGRNPHVLRPRDLQGLRGRPSAVGHLCARGPVDRRRDHVGAGLACFSPAGALAARDRDRSAGTRPRSGGAAP